MENFLQIMTNKDVEYQTKGGVFCRVYTEALTLRNQTEQFEGTACRDDDGVWQPI
jgi:surface antigen